MFIKEYGYEYDALTDEALYRETIGKTATKKYNGAYCLRSGRDALKVVAREYKNATILIPALACDSMVQPFEQYNHNVIFYKYKDTLEIDFDYLLSLINKYKDSIIIFLFMNYFGIESISRERINNLKKSFGNIVFLNDITHTFPYEKKEDFIADYTIVSLRKWVNIPDGGLLWAKKDLKNHSFDKDLSFFEKRLYAQNLRNKFLEIGDLSLKEEYRNIFSTVTEIINNSLQPSLMSEYSYEMLKKINFETIRKKREENAKTIIDILKRENKIKIIQKSNKNSNLYVPIVIDFRNEKQKVLSSFGIFNTIIWPLRNKQKQLCRYARYIEEHILAIPCDQRYTIEDMKHISYEIVRVINE